MGAIARGVLCFNTSTPLCNTCAMERILVWNCGDDLGYAATEVKMIKELYPECKVFEIDDLDWKGLGGLAHAAQPTIFHFIGHGEPKGHLFVRGEVAGLRAEDVIRKVRVASPGLKGVYLSACFSAVNGPELLPPAGGWLVGAGLAVDDDQAALFSEMFYRHLIKDAMEPPKAYELAYAHVASEWGSDLMVHSAYFRPSEVPAIEEMAQNIYTGIRGVFSRSSFRFPMKNEASIKDLEDALDDVTHALGTGQVLSRKYRNVITPLSFKAEWLQAPEVEKFVLTAAKKIAATRTALAVLKAGALDDCPIHAGKFAFDNTFTTAEWMTRVNKVDFARNRVLTAANELFQHSNLPPIAPIERSYTKAQIDGVRRNGGIP